MHILTQCYIFKLNLKMKAQNLKLGGERGFVKLILAIIGAIIILAFFGVRLSTISNIAHQIWNDVIFPAFENMLRLIKSFQS